MNRLVIAATFMAVVLASPAALAADRTIVLSVKNMECEACPTIVKQSLMAVPGVANVVVSFKDGTATVKYDDATANVNQLTTATTNAGYPSLLKG
jgi:mercuric ion binding protein